MRVLPWREGAVLLYPEAEDASVEQLWAAWQAQPLPHIWDAVPAFDSFALYFDVHHWQREQLVATFLQRYNHASAAPKSRLHRIEVCYHPDLAPDLLAVAQHAQLSPERLIACHSAPLYTVQMVGFSPGFGYLQGLDPCLQMPRLATPRLTVPAGSVGIAGAQTGIYPQASPGGWQLIGRTHQQLFDVTQQPPARLQAGDRVRFVPISWEVYYARPS